MWYCLPETLRKLLDPLAQTHAGDDVSAHSIYCSDISPALLWQLELDAGTAGRLLESGAPPSGFRYRHFTVPKKDGTPRELVEPGNQLKAVQRAIVRNLLRDQTPHPAALGFRRGRSIADHAERHAGAALIITADIEDFFPSTQRWRIARWWEWQGYAPTATHLLTWLTSYQGHLPQGAPTSPPLSNLINVALDAALDRCTRQSGGRYSRYVDDLAFSWPDGAAPPADFERTIRNRLRESGYTLHPDKGRQLWRRDDEPELTGLVLTRQGTVELPAATQQQMQSLARSSDPHDRRRLQGYAGYDKMVRRKRKR